MHLWYFAIYILNQWNSKCFKEMCLQTEAYLLCAPIHVETRIQLAGEYSKKNLKCLKTSSKELISSPQFFTVRFNGSLVVLDLGFCNGLESCKFAADSLNFLEVFPLLSTRQSRGVWAAVIIWVQCFLHHYEKKETFNTCIINIPVLQCNWQNHLHLSNLTFSLIVSPFL